MALKISLTKSDAKRALIVDPGWYRAKIGEIEMKKGKADNTANVFHIPCVLTTPGKFKDVPLMTWVSEKFVAAAIPILKAVGVPINEDFEGGDFDLGAVQDKEVEVAIVNELNQGKLQNVIKDFAPLGTNTTE